MAKASRRHEEYMTRSEIAHRNVALMEVLTQEIMENENLARQIPKGASVLILPDNDPELVAVNRDLAQRARKQGEKVVLVRMELVPKTTYVPQLTVLRSVR